MAAEYAFDLWDAEDPKGTFLCRYTVGDQLVDAGFHRVLYGTGDGFIDIHGDDPDVEHIHRRAWVQFVRTDTTPDQYIGGFFLEEGDFRAISKKGQAGRILHFEGRGGLSILDRYSLGHSIYAPFQTHRGDIDVPDKWHWIGEPYGAMLVRLIEEGKHAPGSPYAPIAYGFTRARDSDNLIWDELADYETDILTNGLSLASDFMRLGVVIDCSADLLFRASRSIEDFGTDRSSTSFASGKVLLNGQNIANELPKRIAASQAATHVTIRDRTGDYQTVDEDIDGNPLPGPTRYVTLKSSTTADDAAIIKMGKLHLTALQKHSDQCRIQHIIGPGGASGADGYNPGPDGDYDIGDIVTVDTGSGEYDYDEQPIEVAGIRWYLNETEWMVETELGGQYFSPAQVQTQAVANSTIRNPGILLCQPNADSVGSQPQVTDQVALASDTVEALGITVDEAGGALYVAVQSNSAPTLAWFPAYANAGTPGASSGSFTLIDSQVAGSMTIRIYRMLNPALSTLSTSAVRITLGAGERFIMQVWYLTEVDQSVPEGAINKTSGTGTSGTVTSAADLPDGELVMWAAGWSETNAATVTDPTQAGSDTLDFSESINRSFGFTDQAMAGGHGSDLTPAAGFSGSHPWGMIAWAVRSTTPGSVIAGDGNADLIGTSVKASRCDHAHHVFRDTAPTADDDATEGYPNGTLWVQLDDLGTPTDILGSWRLIDNTAAAAVWIPEGSALSGLSDVDLGSLTDGDVLTWDATNSEWTNEPPAGGSSLTQAWIGKNAIGASKETWTARRVFATKVTLANACLITDIEAYIESTAAGQVIAMQAILLTDNAGSPGEIMNFSAPMAVDTLHTNSGAVRPKWIGRAIGRWVTAGSYWLAVQSYDANTVIYKDTSGGTCAHWTPGTAIVQDATGSTITTTTDAYSIRANTIR